MNCQNEGKSWTQEGDRQTQGNKQCNTNGHNPIFFLFSIEKGMVIGFDT